MTTKKSGLLLDLEQAKSIANKLNVTELATKAAALEGQIADRLIAQSAPEQAVVNLVSQASCLLDARNEKEAKKVYEKALKITSVKETQNWIRNELRRIKNDRNSRTAKTTANVDSSAVTQLPQTDSPKDSAVS